MRLARSAFVAALGAAALLLASCAGQSAPTPADSPADEGPLVIDSFLALSGPAAPAGEAMEIGNRAAIAVLNDEGGVLGHPVELHVHDSAGSPDQLAAKLQELLSSGTPSAVLPGTAAEIPAGIPILANAGVFTSHHWSDAAHNDPEKYPYLFGNFITVPDYVDAFVQELRDEGHASVGVVNSDDSSGQVFQEVARDALERAGIDATFAAVPPTAVDATAQLQQVLADDPDALVFAGYYPAAGAVIAARAKLGVDIPTIGAQTFGANNFSALPEADLDGIVFQHLAVNVANTPQTESAAFKKFYDAVVAEAGGSLPFPVNTYLVAYNDVMLAAYAAELAGSLDPAEMAAAIEGASAADMPNYVMPVGFSETNHFPGVTPDDFVTVPYAPVENGMVVPQS
ncbi:ABC transporter substrate-binding protein [Microbacterium sp.]|uniref:ABC transporter substrate-binding protein n=1 Tax=Microbacterium sp. TaxID=51671 RepID=UPI0037C65CF7